MSEYVDFLPISFLSVSVSHAVEDCYIASVLDDTVLLVEHGDVLESYRGHRCDSYRIQCVFSPHEEFVWCGSSTGTLFCWPLSSRVPCLTMPNAHEGPITAIAFSNPELMKDGKLVRDLEKSVRNSLNREGSLMVSGGKDGYLRVWRFYG